MQKLFLIGFMGKDPEIRFTSKDIKVITFPLAISIFKGGEKITVWYKINCWRETASNIIPHLKKGYCVTVVGDLLIPTTYQNKKGETSIDLTVNASSVSFTPFNKSDPKKTNEDEAIFNLEDIQ